jgi:hypothetical protein
VLRERRDEIETSEETITCHAYQILRSNRAALRVSAGPTAVCTRGARTLIERCMCIVLRVWYMYYLGTVRARLNKAKKGTTERVKVLYIYIILKRFRSKFERSNFHLPNSSGSSHI